MKGAYVTLRRGWPLVALAAAALLFAWPILGDLGNWSANSDWPFITTAPEAARATILEYHQFPLWNPFVYGGMTAIGYLRGAYLAPSFLPVLVFGTYAGLQLRSVLSFAAGAMGAFLLGRRLGMPRESALLCGVVFAFSSVLPLWLYCGAPQYTAAWLMPWVFFFLASAGNGERLLDRGTLGTSVVLAWMFLEGSDYYLAFTLLLVLAIAIVRSLRERRWRPAAAALAACAIAFQIGAVKLLPVVECLTKFPREIETDIEYISTRTVLVDALLDRNQMPFTTHFSLAQIKEAARQGKFLGEWWEYGAYVGVLPLLLALAGAVVAAKRHTEWTVSLVLGALLALGYASPFDVWGPLHHLPGYSSLQFPTRSIILVVLSIAVLGGLALAQIQERLARARLGTRWAGVLAGSVALLVFVDVAAVSRPILQSTFRLAPPPPLERFVFHQTSQIVDYGGIMNTSFALVASNLGAIVTQPDVGVPRSALGVENPYYQGEAFLWPPGSGRAEVERFTPNRVELRIAATRASVAVLNQNFDDGWTAEVNGRRRPLERFRDLLVEDVLRPNYHAMDFEDPYLANSVPHKYANGLLAVRVGVDDEKVTFRYAPASFHMGIVLSLSTLGALGLLALPRTRLAGVAILAVLSVALFACTLVLRARSASWPDVLREDQQRAVAHEGSIQGIE